jgi:hypothetical protein
MEAVKNSSCYIRNLVPVHTNRHKKNIELNANINKPTRIGGDHAT